MFSRWFIHENKRYDDFSSLKLKSYWFPINPQKLYLSSIVLQPQSTHYTELLNDLFLKKYNRSSYVEFFLFKDASADAIAALCQEYKSKAESLCTGFELKRDRVDCNYYRVYCQGKKPVPLIDGSVTNVDTDWALGESDHILFS